MTFCFLLEVGGGGVAELAGVWWLLQRVCDGRPYGTEAMRVSS